LIKLSSDTLLTVAPHNNPKPFYPFPTSSFSGA
jgi:hypothetical protein